MEDRKIASLFKALGDENRIRILRTLRGGEKSAGELLENFKFSQPTLSHHMKVLFDSGLIMARKEGKWMYYSISLEGAKNASQILQHLTSSGNQ